MHRYISICRKDVCTVKKIMVTLTLAIILLIGAVVAPMSASAATKDELFEVFYSIPVSKYIKPLVENAAKNVEITAEQGDELMKIALELKALLPEDNGPTAQNYYSQDGKREMFYDSETIAAVMRCIGDACDILGYTYDFTPSPDPKHTRDLVFNVYDETGRMVFSYDGDQIKATGENESNTNYIYLAIGIALVICAGGIAVFAKKRQKN